MSRGMGVARHPATKKLAFFFLYPGRFQNPDQTRNLTTRRPMGLGHFAQHNWLDVLTRLDVEELTDSNTNLALEDHPGLRMESLGSGSGTRFLFGQVKFPYYFFG